MKHAHLILAFIALLVISACGGGGANTSGNSNVGAPSSIIGSTIVQTVSRSGYVPASPGSTIAIVQPGGTLTYSFIDANTILGEGVAVVPTLSWNYALNGNVATVNMHMTYGDSVDTWTFTSPTGGTFRSDVTLVTGTTAWFEGTFTASPYTAGAPSVTGMSPSSGAVGTTVTITGTNFSTTLANNTVKFNGTSATVTVATATSLTVTVPSGASTGAITVTTVGGTATSVGSFTVSASGGSSVPTITSFSPTSGAAGTTVIISGTNFSSTPMNNTVKFNGTSATVTASTATSLTVTVPSGATTGAISITTAGGATTSATSFTVSTGGGGSAVGIQMGGARQGTPLNLTTVVTTFAGGSIQGFVDGSSTAAQFFEPLAITTDGANLYVADSDKIRKIGISTGTVSTLVGYGLGSGVGAIVSVNGITTDGTNLYLTDSYNNTIVKVVISTGQVSIFAGQTSYGCVPDVDGIGTAATFCGPKGITTDGTNLYVVESSQNVIRKIVISTGMVSTFAGGGSPAGVYYPHGVGTSAYISQPQYITTDGTNLYVNTSYGEIAKIVIATRAVSLLAGKGSWGILDGVGSAAQFYEPYGITTDGTNLYSVDRGSARIRKIVIATGAVTTLAGKADGYGLSTGSCFCLLNGTGTAAIFQRPTDIITDGISLYVLDTANYAIRKIQ